MNLGQGSAAWKLAHTPCVLCATSDKHAALWSDDASSCPRNGLQPCPEPGGMGSSLPSHPRKDEDSGMKVTQSL